MAECSHVLNQSVYCTECGCSVSLARPSSPSLDEIASDIAAACYVGQIAEVKILAILQRHFGGKV